METMIKHNFPKCKLYVRDVIEVISYLFLDPKIMYGWKDHVTFKCHSFFTGDIRTYGNVVSSEWAAKSEEEIRMKDRLGVLLPIIFYMDAVSVSDSHVNNKITPVMCTIGNFSDELQNQVFAKPIISYLPNFNSYSKTILVEHVKDVLNISVTAAESNG